MNYKKLLLLLLIIVQAFTAYSQKVEGSIVNKSKEPVGYATITVYDSSRNILIERMADASGHFTIQVSSEIFPKISLISVQHVSYETKTVPFNRDQTSLRFELNEKAVDLDEIVIKSRPVIRQKGDTLSYDVKSFAKENDRSIGDVMKRMPGIEYTDEGRAYYNGKEISNMYVDGQNLLKNNYRLGADNIRHDWVKDVEVIEGDQEKKVLKDKINSEDVALNLKLKDNIPTKLSGQAALAAGLPSLYQGKLSTLLFNNKIKSINELGANNTGFLMNKTNNRPSKSNLLDISNISQPPIDRNRYNYNQEWNMNSSFLRVISPKWIFHSNIELYADKEDFSHQSIQRYELESSFAYGEQTFNRKKPLLANIDLKLESNLPEKFVKHHLSLYTDFSRNKGQSMFNDNFIDQNYQRNAYTAKHMFEYTPQLKNKNLFTIDSRLQLTNYNENLVIDPNILIQTIEQVPLKQVTDVHNIDYNLSLRYGLTRKVFKNFFTFSTNYIDQSLTSALRKLMGHDQLIPENYLDNDLRWKESSQTIGWSGNIRLTKLEWSASLRAQFTHWNYGDTSFSFQEKYNKLIYLPSMTTRYKFTPNDILELTSTYQTRFRGMESIYRGAILTNFRNLQQNMIPLDETNTFISKLHYSASRPVNGLFFNAGGDYNSMVANNISSRVLTENGVTIETLPIRNRTWSWNLYGGISKIFIDIKATAAIKAAYASAYYNQIFNEVLYKYNNNSVTLSINGDKDIKDILNISFSTDMRWNKNIIVNIDNAKNPDTRLFSNRSSLAILYYANAKTSFKISGINQRIRQSNVDIQPVTFLDFSARYKHSKKLEFELLCYNLLDERKYETFSINNIITNQSTYYLRGAMGMFKISYWF